MINKKAVSPLVATVLLIVFSLILGTITMNIGKAYIEGINEVVINEADNSLKQIGDSLYKCNHFDKEQNKCISWIITE
jgi:flagellin-like protein